jgi:hypothetical protein
LTTSKCQSGTRWVWRSRLVFEQVGAVGAQDLGRRDAFQFLLQAQATVRLSPVNSISAARRWPATARPGRW